MKDRFFFGDKAKFLSCTLVYELLMIVIMRCLSYFQLFFELIFCFFDDIVEPGEGRVPHLLIQHEIDT